MGADIIELGSEETTAPAPPPPPPTGVILSTRAGYKQGAAQVRLFASEMQTPTVCGQ